MNLNANELTTIKKLLKGFYYHEGIERVGFIRGANEILEVQNVAENPLLGFYVSGQDIIKHVEELKCWATWHTHPDQDSNLSGEDFKMFSQWPDMTHFIIGSDGVRAYRFDPAKKVVVQL